MSRFIYLPKVWKIFLISIVVFLLWLTIESNTVFADTLKNDLSINLSIEIGDQVLDYKDADKTIPKGQFVTYKIHIKNTGNKTHYNMMSIMDTPDYMKYIKGSTYRMSNASAVPSVIKDLNGISFLEIGYEINYLSPGQEAYLTSQFQVNKDILDDKVYTLAWANLLDQYATIPMTSNLIENKISGKSIPSLQVAVATAPKPNSKVGAGFQIAYNYTIRNLGGQDETNVNLITYLPSNTKCIKSCGSIQFDKLASNGQANASMIVEVNKDYGSAKEIKNIGYDISGDHFSKAKDRTPIVHILDESQDQNQSGNFTVNIVQEPNIILNSADGKERSDNADKTETKYTLAYKGRQKFNTYPTLSTSSKTQIYDNRCGVYEYPRMWGTTTYAYNSGGGGCDDIYKCPPISSPINFSIKTTLPTKAPKLSFTKNTTNYKYGSTSEVNAYMKAGGSISPPKNFTQSRAVENGSMGIVATTVESNVSEEMYRYDYVGQTRWCTYRPCSNCGTYEVQRPNYRWYRVTTTPVRLKDDDSTNIDVYTSTAWLKTTGGHLGTNDKLTNGAYTSANYVNLGTPTFSNHLTLSSLYTPPGETNGDYMIFSKNGTGSFKTKSGDAWKIAGTEFPFVQRGNTYDRSNNPRNYYEDMLTKEKFGEVKENKIPSKITGSIDLEDGLIWKNKGDIIIGDLNTADTVIFKGGRSRIYTDGDVYINANIKYQTSSSNSYKNITSVRIDARNIYISGEVTDLEVMMLARGTFKSGKSKKQLRILGDVITNQAVWEREPILEFKPSEFNKPSEYIIEDIRKYVLPPPGDTKIPDNNNVWRQVNSSTGEALDEY